MQVDTTLVRANIESAATDRLFDVPRIVSSNDKKTIDKLGELLSDALKERKNPQEAGVGIKLLMRKDTGAYQIIGLVPGGAAKASGMVQENRRHFCVH